MLNAYKKMYFDRNINGIEIRMRKFWIVIVVSCVTLGEFYLSVNFKYKTPRV